MLQEPGNPSAHSRSRSISNLDSIRCEDTREGPRPSALYSTAQTYQELSGDRNDDSSRLSRGLAVHGGNVVRTGLKGQGGELLHDVLRPLHLLALPRQHGAVLVKGSQLCSSTGSIEGLVVVLHESLGGGGCEGIEDRGRAKARGFVSKAVRARSRAHSSCSRRNTRNWSPTRVLRSCGRSTWDERKGSSERDRGRRGKRRRTDARTFPTLSKSPILTLCPRQLTVSRSSESLD